MLKKIALQTMDKNNLISQNEHIVVGVSGGADSISLLYFLNSIKNDFNLKITAVHINHCMRGEESNQDNDFVIDFCKKINIPIKCFSFDIYKKSKELSLSLEETGRKFRYSSFEQVLKEVGADKIAVAHNKDDNAETILMRFFRGAGLKGLSGIPYKRDNIIRPLLDCERKAIELYCNENNITFRNDSTNSMDIYTRNKLRLNIIPNIRENFNPNITTTLTNMSNIFIEEDTFLNKLAKDAYSKILIKENDEQISLNIKYLKEIDLVLQKRVIRLALSHFNKNLHNISLEHINIIIGILDKGTGKCLNLPNNTFAYTQYNVLYISTKNINSVDISYNYELELEKVIFIKELNKNILLSSKNTNNSFFSTKVYTISLNYDKIKNRLFLRQRNAGDKLILNGMTKKVKNLFIDLKIPSNERSLYPILICENSIIGILGLCISNEYQADNLDNTIYLHIWEESFSG